MVVRWSTLSCAVSSTDSGVSESTPGVGFLTFGRSRSRGDRPGAARPIRSVARPGRLAAPARSPVSDCAGHRRRLACGWPNESCSTRFHDARQTTPAAVGDVAGRRARRAKRPWALVDGNIVSDPAPEIIARLSGRPVSPSLLAVTVMPGPQLSQAVPVCKAVPRRCRTCRSCGEDISDAAHRHGAALVVVDYVVRSQGEQPLLQLSKRCIGRPADAVSSLSWKEARGSHCPQRRPAPMTTLDELPDLPYRRVDGANIHPTYSGSATVAHNSSFGCPFACSFCAVVAMTIAAGWRSRREDRAGLASPGGRIPDRRGDDARHGLLHLRGEGVGVRRAHRAARAQWWALGRVDTLMQYSDATWRRWLDRA